jgi:hypothetical protein
MSFIDIFYSLLTLYIDLNEMPEKSNLPGNENKQNKRGTGKENI